MALFSSPVERGTPYGGSTWVAKTAQRLGKYGTKRRNIVELAEVGAWIAGTGGADPRKSAGHDKLIYALRVK